MLPCTLITSASSASVQRLAQGLERGVIKESDIEIFKRNGPEGCNRSPVPKDFKDADIHKAVPWLPILEERFLPGQARSASERLM